MAKPTAVSHVVSVGHADNFATVLMPPRYLNKKARTCYWFKLLTEFSKLLRYDVSPRHEVAEELEELEELATKKGNKSRATQGWPRGEWMTVQSYLKEVAASWEDGHRFSNKTETW